MNRLEAAWRDELEMQKRAGLVLWYAYEAIKLRLADATFYTPDFFVMNPRGELLCHEVKGHWEDDARVKIKVAASLFPFAFVGITRTGGEWKVEEF